MAHKATVKNPDECREMFNLFAGQLDTYANDQVISKRWVSTKKAKDNCEIRAEVYRSLANEMREIEWIKE